MFFSESTTGIEEVFSAESGEVTVYSVTGACLGTYSNGTTLTILNKEFALDEIGGMTVDYTSVTDNTVEVSYNGSTATITVAGNVAQYLTITQSGAHVSIAQSDDLAEEITYTLTGTSTDGGSNVTLTEYNGSGPGPGPGK